uniref:E3 UFM1-protein ligase 1 n=1 Tax=Sus scrofa TaxID=9823 RepID=A0A8D0TPJ8_PIG
MADAWEEIRRLAADFQRAQFAEATQRLSERNCIEIVNKLIAQKQLEVVHTLDGKEYITPAQISKEMRDELHVRGGRVNIVDLQQVINVDLTHIENRVGDIIKSEKHVQLVLGQLIDENYLDRLAEEVNDKLQESGQVTISELCKTYDLPGNFLTQALTQRLGKIINGHFDLDNRGVIYTEAFVARHKARIRGLFSAITRYTSEFFDFKIWISGTTSLLVLEELVNSGRLRGTVVGGRQDKAVFVPDIYSRTQSTWVDSFFRQNGYLEFDALSRLGIPDAVSYIKKRYKTIQLLFLKAACIGQGLVDQVEASVEEAISSGTWVDIAPLLPSSLSVEDAAILLQHLLRALSKQTSAVVFSDTVVVSEKFINDCVELFSEPMHQKAEKEMKNNPVHLITEEDLKQISSLESTNTNKKDKKDERRRKATEGSGSVRGGGGGNAREYKIKKIKKKGRKDDDSDDESSHTGRKKPEITFMFQDEIEDFLRKHLQDAPEEFISELAEYLIKPLNKTYLEVVRSVFMSSTSSASGTGRKRTIKDLQEEVSNLYNNIRLFEKGTKFFTDDTQAALTKHLLKTVCTDITNLIFNFLASDLMMAVDDPAAITSEVRKKILSKLSEETKVALSKLHSSLNEKSIEDFLSCLDSAAEACDIMVKKGDKKRERQILFQHRQALTEQLKVTEDPALILHLTSVLLFQFLTHSMLHAPGRCVPQIIAFLSSKIPEDQHTLLVKYQGLVVKHLLSQNKKTGQGENSLSDELDKEQEDITNTTRKELQELSSSIKDLVLKSRKSSMTEE